MNKTRQKLSIVALMIAVIVCFTAAILGLTVAPSAKVSADTTPVSLENVTARTATLSGPDDETRKTIFIQTRLPHSEDATKIYLEYVLINDNLVGKTANLLALTYPQGAGKWDYKSIGIDANTNVLAANNGGLYMATYLITYDLQTNGLTWYRGSTELVNSVYDVVLADMEKFGLMLQPSPVGEVITFRVYDDKGKDLGITTNTPDVVTIEYPKVTFEANNGEEAAVVDVKGATIAKPADPVKENATFLGWYTDKNFENEYDFNSEVTKDITLYARWIDFSNVTARTATLSGPDDGSRKTVFIKTRLPHSKDATKVFIEYVLTNDNLVDNTASVNALAYPQGAGTWDYKAAGAENNHIAHTNNGMLYTGSYLITFDLKTNGVTWYRGSTNLELNNPILDTELANIEKFGMLLQPSPVGDVITFKIYDDMGKDLGVMTNTPDSVTIEYPKVTFEANNGEEAAVVNVEGATITAPAAPTKEGHVFGGWYTDEGLTTAYNFDSEVSKDMTLYAKWYGAPNTYYMISDASQSDPWKWTTAETPAENATKVMITFKVISRTGTGRHFQILATDGLTEKTTVLSPFYKFGDDWFPNGVTVTFVADLTAKTYTMYGANGEERLTTTFDSENKFGAIIYMEYPAAVVGLYEVTAVDDTGKDLGIASSSKGVTIATDKIYTINMNANNGEAVSKSFVVEGSALSKTTPLYAGHLFKGWYTDAELTTAYDFTQEVNSDLTLYAKWVSIDHIEERTVTLLGEEQLSSASKEIEVRSRLSISEGATKVYIEYTLGNDNGEGNSFLFGLSAGTLVAAYTQEDVWNGSERFSQVNSHVWGANNAALYSASYTAIFDLVTNQITWYRGTTLILEGTGVAFAEAISFGFWTGTAAANGSMTIKIYDDMGKDLGVRSINMKDMTLEFPKATFDVNYDGGEDVVVDIKDATIVAPENVYRNGYKLVGWYADAACNTEFDFTEEIAGDITIYAKWEEIPQVTVNFNTNGGTAVEPQTINIDTTATEPTTTKTGFIIEGWYTDAACTLKFNFATIISEDITLYAKWSVQTFIVSFYTNGGNTIEDAAVEYGNKVTAPAAPTKPGYEFVGWFANEELTNEFDFDTEIFANTTIYAKWIEATYTVIFNTNGGGTIDPQTFNYGDALSAPTVPTKTNFTFMGWYLDEALTRKANFPISVEENITLYAKWEVVVYTVSFDTDCDTVIDDVQVNSGATVEKPADPVKDGYTFEGWYAEVNGEDEFDFNTPITSNITLYARWKAIPVNKTEGCGSSLGGNSIAIGGVMLAAAAFIAIKGLKKKED